MSDSIRDLYQQVILDHSKKPKNFRIIEHCSHHATGQNPLCGDQLVIFLQMEKNIISDISFKGDGCAISKASASIMTETIKGKTKEEALSIFKLFHNLVTTGEEDSADLGKLKVMAGVHKYPVRVKCASLCWHTLKNALEESTETAITE